MKTDIILSVKFVAVLASLPMMAFGATVGPLPQSDYADNEVSTNLSFHVDLATVSRIEFTLSLVASPSNVVEVSIGTDANADGILSLGETDQAFGYDCGQWFRRDSVENQVEVQGGGGGSGRVEHQFVLKRRRLNESWNLVKVVRRGVAGIGEVVLVEGKRPGVVLFVR